MNKLIYLIKQVFIFGIVGTVCFIIDFSIMVLLTHFLKINYIVSCGISFIISCIVNYILSIRYVFVKKVQHKKHTEFSVFFAMSIVGLILTEFLMFTFVEKIHFHYTISKIVVTVLVMSYNFISRKLFFESHRKE